MAEDDGAVEGRLEVGEELGEGVYRVERVVERRKRKVSCSCTANYFSTMYIPRLFKGRMECLVLWDGFKQEEATWIREEEVTAAALRYLVKLY